MTNAYNDAPRYPDPIELLARTAVRRLEEMGCRVHLAPQMAHSTVTGPMWIGEQKLAGAILWLLTIEAATYVRDR